MRIALRCSRCGKEIPEYEQSVFDKLCSDCRKKVIGESAR